MPNDHGSEVVISKGFLTAEKKRPDLIPALL